MLLRPDTHGAKSTWWTCWLWKLSSQAHCCPIWIRTAACKRNGLLPSLPAGYGPKYSLFTLLWKTTYSHYFSQWGKQQLLGLFQLGKIAEARETWASSCQTPSLNWAWATSTEYHVDSLFYHFYFIMCELMLRNKDIHPGKTSCHWIKVPLNRSTLCHVKRQDTLKCLVYTNSRLRW